MTFTKGHTPRHKGKKMDNEYKERCRNAQKGKKLSEKHKINIGLGGIGKNLGKKHSEESRIKMSINSARKGNKPRNYGLEFSKESKEKMRKAKLGSILTEEHKNNISKSLEGDKCWLRQGGKSFEIYTIDFTRRLKKSVRERDNNTCQICGAIKGYRKHDVHHIDYNKENCNIDNLITLCQSCHTKTNYNREKWIEYFREKMIISQI